MDRSIPDFKKDTKLEGQLLRYATGTPLTVLAQEEGVLQAAMRKRMQRYDIARYMEAKEKSEIARRSLRHIEHLHIVNVNRKNVIRAVDRADELDDMEVAEMCKIEKVFGDKVDLREGLPTERSERNIKAAVIVKFADLDNDDTE